MRTLSLEGVNRLDEAIRAYHGICDLVSEIDRGDLGSVDPANLWFLFKLVRDKLDDARLFFD